MKKEKVLKKLKKMYKLANSLDKASLKACPGTSCFF